MACKINWTPKALSSYELNIRFLQENWSDNEVRKFINLADK